VSLSTSVSPHGWYSAGHTVGVGPAARWCSAGRTVGVRPAARLVLGGQYTLTYQSRMRLGCERRSGAVAVSDSNAKQSSNFVLYLVVVFFFFVCACQGTRTPWTEDWSTRRWCTRSEQEPTYALTTPCWPASWQSTITSSLVRFQHRQRMCVSRLVLGMMFVAVRQISRPIQHVVSTAATCGQMLRLLAIAQSESDASWALSQLSSLRMQACAHTIAVVAVHTFACDGHNNDHVRKAATVITRARPRQHLLVMATTTITCARLRQ
jgi:hypothetical protein